MNTALMLRSLAVCGLLSAAGLTQAATDCERPAPELRQASGVSAGRPSLGDGVALFDARKLKLAERALQSALFLGLADSQEQATAHKYLAFVFCSNGEWLRCETAFDAALALRSTFSLEARELEGAPWREVYLRSMAKAAPRCGQPGAGAGSSAGVARATQDQPYAFALHSAVIVGIVPLLPVSALPAARSASVAQPIESMMPRSGNNVRLRVSPWAYVQVDGKRVGVTPALTELKLSPGAHTIELRNPGFELVRKAVRLPQDEPVLISHDFEAR